MVVLDSEEIMRKLPHRYPFLLLDRVVHIDENLLSIIGMKCVTINEPFFQGHFPQMPIMPGVLIVEALAQVAGVLAYHSDERFEKEKQLAILLSINRVKFRKPVLPGDTLFLHAHCSQMSAKGGKFQTKALVEDKKAAEAELSFVFKPVGDR